MVNKIVNEMSRDHYDATHLVTMSVFLISKCGYPSIEIMNNAGLVSQGHQMSSMAFLVTSDNPNFLSIAQQWGHPVGYFVA